MRDGWVYALGVVLVLVSLVVGCAGRTGFCPGGSCSGPSPGGGLADPAPSYSVPRLFGSQPSYSEPAVPGNGFGGSGSR